MSTIYRDSRDFKWLPLVASEGAEDAAGNYLRGNGDRPVLPER
jgi:hypothetical protein